MFFSLVLGWWWGRFSPYKGIGGLSFGGRFVSGGGVKPSSIILFGGDKSRFFFLKILMLELINRG